MERATWGDQALTPVEIVIALAGSGNIPYGAFDGNDLVGFVLGWAGVNEADGLHVHSHQLAAVPTSRHRGVGHALKLAQRAQALDQGISLVRWTFDPLVSRNAWFNIVKLGASADRFLPDHYGEMTDEVNRGDRSDRLLVRWDLRREPMGPASQEGQEVLGREGDGLEAHPGPIAQPTAERVLVRIPREYHEMRLRDPGLANAWRGSTGEALKACFDRGLIVTGFTEDSSYVLTRAAT